MDDFDFLSVLAPDGQLEPRWFYGLSEPEIAARLGGFYQDGRRWVDGLPTQEDFDEASEAWVYASAYSQIAAEMARRVGTVEIFNESLKTTSRVGADFFQARADYWLGIFHEFVPEAKPVPLNKQATVTLTSSFRF